MGHPAAESRMVKSAFRPSDDVMTLPFLVPTNAMAVVDLRRTTTIVQALIGDGGSISSECSEIYLNGLVDDMTFMANTIDAGIQKYGIGVHPLTGNKQYAYEVDLSLIHI